MNQAVIGVGSNINPEFNIARGRQIIAENFTVIKESDFIQTKPIGYTQQADFINGAVFIQTELSLAQLKEALRMMEKQMGRAKTTIKSGPRIIDLDVIIWNNEIIDEDFHTRDFLRNSVYQLIPDFKY